MTHYRLFTILILFVLLCAFTACSYDPNDGSENYEAFYEQDDDSADDDTSDDDSPDDDSGDDDTDGNISIEPAGGTIHNPFGVMTAQIDARVPYTDIRTVRIRAENVPEELLIRFKPSVVFFQNTIQTTMSIHGRMAAEQTCGFAVVVQWTDKWGRTWQKETAFTLNVVTDFDLEDIPSWTKNPYLIKEIGLWANRTFCWTIGSACDIQPQPNSAEWVDDSVVHLYAEDDNRFDFGCDCATLTQGESILHPGTIYGAQLDPIRTGDVSHAFILFTRSDFGTGPTPMIGAAGNIINLWIQHPDGDYFGFDFYFETEGMDNWTFINGERLWWPDFRSCVYSVHMFDYPQYWSRTETTDGMEYWIIDLGAIIDRASELSRWDLEDFEWKRVEPICESFALVSGLVTSAWQTIHYFDIKVAFSDDQVQ